MAYLTVKRIWDGEFVPLAHANMTMNSAAIIMARLEKSDLAISRPVDERDYLVEIETDDGDLASDPVKVSPEKVAELAEFLGLEIEMLSDSHTLKNLAEMWSWFTKKGTNDE